MITALDISDGENYTLRTDEAEPKTIFRLGFLDSEVRAMFVDRYVKEPKSLRLIHDVVRHGLRGWENFKDSAGAPVEFTTESSVGAIAGRKIATLASMGRLSVQVIHELGNRIMEMNFPSEQAEKN